MTKPFPFTQEFLLNCFEFNFDLGLIYFKERHDIQNFNSHAGRTRWNSKVGQRAFESPHNKGYLQGKFNYEIYLTHRIIFFAFHGLQPIEIDHLDRNKWNNSISNLEAVSRHGNTLNTNNRGRSPNQNNDYRAAVIHNGKQISLGCYKSASEANKVMDDYRKENNLLEPKYVV